LSGPERAILVGCPDTRDPSAGDASLDELARLAETAGLVVADRVVQPRRRIDAATFIGAGKVQEVGAAREAGDASVVVLDEPLSPAQQRNLERALDCKVIDRSALILDIFAQHARSLEGKLQVELAQLEYMRPRLTRQWTHLSRLGGGVGTRGPGETQLEVDRRRIRERIAQLRRRLATIERSRALHRRERHATPCPTVALVGYTNAGKSTLMNRLTRAGVLVQDQLFATLDPTARRLRLPTGLPAVLIDTVGFIHKLPHELIEAFKSTLEEVREADLLVHLVDASSPEWPRHVDVVRRVLEEIGAGQLPMVTAYNKADRPWELRPSDPHGVAISARTGRGVEALLDLVARRLEAGLARIEYDLPLDRADLLSLLRRSGRIVTEAYAPGHVAVTALVPPRVAGQVRRALG
jgi:GTP-binding protein HflX